MLARKTLRSVSDVLESPFQSFSAYFASDLAAASVVGLPIVATLPAFATSNLNVRACTHRVSSRKTHTIILSSATHREAEVA